jgi:seryl-tRNA(Sec) selenium transferase
MERREILKSLAILPLAGGLFPINSALVNSAKANKLGPLVLGPSIYESIGVDTIINCRGTFTIIGGSIERPEVHQAMQAASGNFAQYDELALGIGKRLAELTGAEWGIVTAGCAAAMKHATAACVAGGNPEKLIRIPDLTGLDKTEVIMPRYSRNTYDHAIRNVGVKIITVDSPEELVEAINPKTAMIYINSGRGSATGEPLSLEVIAELAKPKNIPVFIDAAAENLTIPNMHLERGATMVAYSGGKAICGPQCAGILLGNKDLLMSAWQASSPHHGPGRDNKVGKEEMFGMLAAVEAWVQRDHKGEWNTWLSRLDLISNRVAAIEGVTTRVEEPTGLSNLAPTLNILWDPNKLHVSGEELAEELGRNKPRVAVGGRTEGESTFITITPSQMQDGEDKIVADRVFTLLSQKRSPKSNTLASPSANIKGRWEVQVNFFSSNSQHKLFLEQDGNWIQGLHQGDFSTQDVVGTLTGNELKLRSVSRQPGDSILYLFSGTVNEEGINGSIFMGEYLSAQFTAKKMEYQPQREEIMIPGGPPLAT